MTRDEGACVPGYITWEDQDEKQCSKCDIADKDATSGHEFTFEYYIPQLIQIV